VRFHIPTFPYAGGKYWVTIGLTSRNTGKLYHVQTQRYLLEVIETFKAQERVEIPVVIEVEDL
jgi:hypothetical protein